MPINNQTHLNSTQFTYISSGGPDFYLNKEENENILPWDINDSKYQNIPNGDRYTLFLNQLYTNYFLIDLNMMSRYKSCIVSFYTTKDFSFSLSRYGNKPQDVRHDIYLSENAKKWSKSSIRNLEAYFEGYPENKVLFFQFYIYKPKSYQLYVDLEVIDPESIEFFSTSDGYTYVDKIKYNIIYNK